MQHPHRQNGRISDINYEDLRLKCLSSMQKCDLVLANQLGHKHTSPRNLPIPIKRFASTPQHPQNPFVEDFFFK